MCLFTPLFSSCKINKKKDAAVLSCAKKRWTQVYSLCVAGGPRQPLGLLQDEDRSRNVIRRALDLIRRQPQELRSAVREFQRQIRASRMVSVGATSHHASHKIGHRRFHTREHGPAKGGAVRCGSGDAICVTRPTNPRTETQFGGVQKTDTQAAVKTHSDPGSSFGERGNKRHTHTHKERERVM